MQNRRALIFFAFAILFGVAAAFTAHRALESRVAAAPEAAPIETVDVVITRSDVTTGAVLTAASLTTVSRPSMSGGVRRCSAEARVRSTSRCASMRSAARRSRDRWPRGASWPRWVACAAAARSWSRLT